MGDVPQAVPAMLITSRNSVLVAGLTWHRVKELARTLGVPIYRFGARSYGVPCTPFLRALEDSQREKRAPGALDPLDQMLVDMGARER